MTGPKHSCGVVGIKARFDVAPAMFTALMIIQHRGQESAGISVFSDGSVETVKGNGLVDRAIPKDDLVKLRGKVGLGHVRYSASAQKDVENAQPLVATSKFGSIAVAHNGDITNSEELKRRYMDEDGWTFHTNSDCELINKILSKHMSTLNDPVGAIRATMSELDGAYSLTILINDRLFGVRDPYAFRPLCIGKIDEGFMLVSESAAIDAVRGEFIRDLEPGEICELTEDAYTSYIEKPEHSRSMCMFEWVYFARPDSVIDGRGVYEIRKRIGEVLARECPADADLVMPIPDSGRAHAIGYAIEMGLPYEEGFMKNRFAGRTFILPDQSQREHAVSNKMIPIRSTVKDKRVVIVDDSIVRGTTLKKLVAMLKGAGAKEVHVRVGSPPIIAPCYYGVDMTTRDQFIANHYSVEEIREILGADSIGYISLDGMVEAFGFSREDLCLACTNGIYPTPIKGEVSRDE